MKQPSREKKTSADKVADELASLFHFEEEDASERFEQKPMAASSSEDKAEPQDPLIKTSNKPATNLEQTSNTVYGKLATNWQQTSNKSRSIKKKLATEPATQLRTNRQQTGNKLATNLHLEALAGLQREALIFIYGNCRNLGSKVSPPIQIKNLAQVIKASVAVARVTVQRIETKGFISRVEYKEGRGGWTKYKLPDEIYSQLLFRETGNKLATNLEQTGNKLATEPTTEPATSAPIISISSLDLEKENNTGALHLESEDSESLQYIGFQKGHLAQLEQIKNQGLISKLDLEASLRDYAFDARAGKVTSVNLLFKELRNRRPYHSAEREKTLRFEIQKIQKAQEESRRMEAELAKAKHAIAYTEWLNTLTEEERKALLRKYPSNLSADRVLDLEFRKSIGEVSQ